jgi:hypothetical protein
MQSNATAPLRFANIDRVKVQLQFATSDWWKESK